MTRIQEGPYKGNFKDDEIAEFLTSSIDDCANAMGPQQVGSYPIEPLALFLIFVHSYTKRFDTFVDDDANISTHVL
jgi:hypothetical protein